MNTEPSTPSRADVRKFSLIWDDNVGDSGADVTDNEILTFSAAILAANPDAKLNGVRGFVELWDSQIGTRVAPLDASLAKFGLLLEQMLAAADKPETVPAGIRKALLWEAAELILAQVRKVDAETEKERNEPEADWNEYDEAKAISYRRGMQGAAHYLLLGAEGLPPRVWVGDAHGPRFRELSRIVFFDAKSEETQV